MRKDAHVEPACWTREWRQALRLSDAAFKVLNYCETGPESHRTGIHFITSGTIAEMIFEDRESVDAAFEALQGAGLLMRDSEANLVYLPNQCATQFAWKKGEPKTGDYRIIEAKRHIASLPESDLVRMFLSKWPIFGSDEAPYQAPCQAPTTTTTTTTATATATAAQGEEGCPNDRCSDDFDCEEF